MNSIRRSCPCAIVLALVAGCTGDGATVGGPVAGLPGEEAPPPPTVNAVHGRYVGTVTIGGVAYFADALFTPGGEARIYIGGAGDGSGGMIPDHRPDTASQFVGSLSLEPGAASGTGLVIGEGCGIPTAGRFCDHPAAAGIQFPGAAAGFASELEGALEVTTGQGVETWPLTLTPWDNFYPFGTELQYVAGQYLERIAEFASGDDTVVVIDAGGQVFFQSAGSGCTGHGSVAPDPDYNVLTVTLTIASCGAAFEHLDGNYSGLGTFSTSDYWNYDSVLRMWLSKSGDDARQAAITQWVVPIL